ncbi:hypothetical protein G5C60_03455 [Streptomyces sp. HC44]|uniref:Uncharacterized protein n=1 Tax=Streptomyces scabichelini TaxID=2711217 RepID=A0A6G4UYS0_9ACTN|nr:hypothetical protein [Streptomyces scabichelini]NGO06744.1 hypothetical protein [Streptomyces scabichelini]
MITDESVQELLDAAKAVREAWVEVALAGPKQVADLAGKIDRLSNGFPLSAKLYQRQANASSPEFTIQLREQLQGDSLKLRESLEEFVLIAQAALDDDGSLR